MAVRCKEEEDSRTSSHSSSKAGGRASYFGFGAAPGLGQAGGAGADSPVRHHCLEEPGFGGKEEGGAPPARNLAG